MTEQQIQKKILDYLRSIGFYVFKTITCNRNGIADIIACSPTGRFWAIEVKKPGGQLSKLQKWNIEEVKKRNGVAMIAYSLEEVQAKVREYHHDQRLSEKFRSSSLES